MSLAPTLSESVTPRVDAGPFATALVRLLRHYGAPAHRLELAMAAFSARLGVDAVYHVLPTSILASSGARGVELLDVASAETDLDRLCAVDEVAQAVADGAMTPTDGLGRLRAIEAAPSHVTPALDALGWIGASGSAALFFGGGPAEAAVAGLVGLLAFGLSSVDALAKNALGEVLSATIAAVAVHALPGVAGEPVLLGGLVGMYPGLRLTIGMTDLATGHHVSGSSGLLSAGVTLLQLGFGVALGTQIGASLFGVHAPATAVVPWWAEPVGLLVGALAFAVLLRARRIHVPQILLATLVAMGGERLGTALLGGPLAGGVAAFLLTVTTNALSRRLDRPGAVTQVAGIWLLVPGSLGFRAVRALLEQDVVHGVEAAFSTVLSAMALVAGTLLANAVIAPRRTI